MDLTSYFKIIDGENHKNFLRKAYKYAWNHSEDNSTKVGAIIIDATLNEILTYGTNKYPYGVHPTKEQEENKNWKYKNIIHAEIDAINKLKENNHNSTTNLSLVMYLTWSPCEDCAYTIKKSGIKKIITHKEMILKKHNAWQKELDKALTELEKKVELLMYDGKIGQVKNLFKEKEWNP
jgi:dCMP deaminase